MNKSIILSAMLALSMPAFAADVLYVNGNASQTVNGQTPSWSVVTPIEVQPIDGKFIVEVKSFSDISISTVKAETEDWTVWGTGQYCISNWVKGVKVGDGAWEVGTNFPGKFVGCTTALEKKAQSMGAANAGMNGDYTFVFDQALTQCQILPHALYLTGDAAAKINDVAANYDISNSAKVSKADGVFTFNVTIPGGVKTRINVSTTTPLSGNRNWEFYNAGQFSATINSETLGTAVDLAHASTGLIFADDVPAGDYTVTISEDLSTVTVTEKAVTPAVTTLYVNGGEGQIVNGTTITTDWTITDPVAVPLVDGKFTIKVDKFNNIGISTAKAEADGEDWNKNWNPNKIGFKKDATLGIAKAIETAKGEPNETDFSATALRGTKGGSYTLIIPADLSTITVLPNQIYIAGDSPVTVNGTTSFTGDWDTAITNPHKVDLDEANGVFAFTLTTTSANGQVDFATLFANDGTTDWASWSNGQFSTEDNTYSEANINIRKPLIKSTQAIRLEKAGTYNVAVARDMSYVILCEDATGTIDTGTYDYYATFSNPYSDIELGGEGIEVYNVTVSGEQLVLTKRSDNKVAKGEGVLVKVSNNATISVKPIDAGLTPAAESENYLKPTPVTAGTVSESGFMLYRLAYDNFTNKTGLGFYLGNADGSITYTTAKPYKAYLKVPTTMSAQIKKYLINPKPTHVDGVSVTEQESEQAIYDISGRRVENPAPGFYIQGNKKIVIR